MCLAIPGKVVDLCPENDVLMGKVDFTGVSKRVCLDLVPEVALGDYVLVHVGFALARIDAAEAARIFQVLEELRQLGELEAPSA
jgi:hydrogenase expression/formation protein HypC